MIFFNQDSVILLWKLPLVAQIFSVTQPPSISSVNQRHSYQFAMIDVVAILAFCFIFGPSKPLLVLIEPRGRGGGVSGLTAWFLTGWCSVVF